MTSSPLPKRVTHSEIERWLVEEIARRAGIPRENVDTTQPFSSYNLDSMQGVNMAGALEDFLGLELEPTLVWDFPTIDKLSRHLAAELSESAGVNSGEEWSR
jgi:acyl carrier protein